MNVDDFFSNKYHQDIIKYQNPIVPILLVWCLIQFEDNNQVNTVVKLANSIPEKLNKVHVKLNLETFHVKRASTLWKFYHLLVTHVTFET